MLAAIKAEFRKLLTTRSTYFIFIFAFILELIFAFWANGYKVSPTMPQTPFFLQSQIMDAVSALALIGAFVGVLLVTHEYRYNTIMYTLTASNSRAKVLAAKIIVATAYALVFTVVMAALAPLLSYIGLSLHGYTLGPQTFYFASFVPHVLFYGWGFVMMGVLLSVLIRSQIGAFAALLLLPGLVEQLLTLVLKSNAVYLPFSAMNAVLHFDPRLSSGEAVGVFMIYLVVGWLIAFILFKKRDAN
jgi:ABC-type transport system involved in multi-copper enzyme maturation permease subunit